MIVPVIATFIFSISTRWDRTIWPEGYTLKWWQTVIERPAFSRTLKNSFIASLATMLCLLVLVTPTAYWMRVRVPKLRAVSRTDHQFFIGVPGVVLALALIRFYSKVPLPIHQHTSHPDRGMYGAVAALHVPPGDQRTGCLGRADPD